jgi:hypothetical protein
MAHPYGPTVFALSRYLPPHLLVPALPSGEWGNSKIWCLRATFGGPQTPLFLSLPRTAGRGLGEGSETLKDETAS